MNLSLQNIHKQYGSHLVLQFEEWKITNGVYWLKGGNGTGKTTLFKIISGQIPFDGKVVLNGIELKKQPIQFKSQISYAEAEPSYPLFITGNDLLSFYRDLHNAKQSELDELVEIFEMKAFLSQKIGGYSSGMLKKLSLIAAFLGDVALYILDEPLITIDAASATKLYQLITKKTELGKSFLLSSHQEINAANLPIDAVFKIEDKKIVLC